VVRQQLCSPVPVRLRTVTQIDAEKSGAVLCESRCAQSAVVKLFSARRGCAGGLGRTGRGGARDWTRPDEAGLGNWARPSSGSSSGRPPSVTGQILAFLPGFGLIMLGLVSAGPWLTMAGTRIMARRTSRPGTLIAARRLGDDLRAGVPRDQRPSPGAVHNHRDRRPDHNPEHQAPRIGSRPRGGQRPGGAVHSRGAGPGSIIADTMPLLRRITGPEVARNE